jgi:hypothetical protein
MGHRFIIKDKDGFVEGTRIIVDTETGVQYLMAHWTNIGGITVLVDKDGKPCKDFGNLSNPVQLEVHEI